MFAKLGRWCFRNRGKVALLWLWSFGTEETDIVARYLVEP